MTTLFQRFIKNGGVAVIPTDTIYGIVGSALNKDVVEEVYELRKRSPDKPFIILVANVSQIEKFGVKLSKAQKEFLSRNWPGKISVVLPCVHKKFEYLHRGAKSLAFRVPSKNDLRELLAKTGPLIAPSANPEGKKPASTVDEAIRYFGDNIAAYKDGGKISGKASTIISLSVEGVPSVIRKGAVVRFK